MVAPVQKGILRPGSLENAAADLAPGHAPKGPCRKGALVGLGEPPAVRVAGRGGEARDTPGDEVLGDDRSVGGVDEDHVELSLGEPRFHVAEDDVVVVAQVPDPGPGEGRAGIDGDSQIGALSRGLGEGVDFVGHAGDLGRALGVDEHVFGDVASLEGDLDHGANGKEGQRGDHDEGDKHGQCARPRFEAT